ncbi:MAG TPA: hypothetical protein VFZ58_01305 [Candidatus Saccharimonadales bacterium]
MEKQPYTPPATNASSEQPPLPPVYESPSTVSGEPPYVSAPQPVNQASTQPPQQTAAAPALGEQPQVVYTARPITPPKPELTPEERHRHEHSQQMYPSLNLSEGEYIISAVRRHPIGLLSIWFVVGLILCCA